MEKTKTRSIQEIEKRMAGVEGDPVRYHVLESAKDFKTSWVGLGQALYSVWKDKLYKEWGYITFDAYASKEIGIRKQTALKLLKSYYFLEKEEPAYLKDGHEAPESAAVIPSYEAVNLLRLAKDKKEIDSGDYINLRREVLELGREAGEVKKGLNTVIKQRREESDPEEAREKRRVATIKRFVATLKAIKRDMGISKLLPSSILREAEELIKKIEEELCN